MSQTQTVQTVVTQDIAQALTQLAIERTMLKADGQPNISQAARFVLEFGLTSLRLDRRRADRGVAGRVQDVRHPQSVVSQIQGGSENE